MEICLNYISLGIFLSIVKSSFEARILGIFPTPSISHQLPFRTIMRALAERGHQVTVLTTDPLKYPIPNYTEIDLSFSYGQFRSELDWTAMEQTSAYSMVPQVFSTMIKLTDDQLSSSQVQKFIRSSNNTKFDLVFLEAQVYQAYYGLIHHVGSPPLIGILTFGYIWAVADVVGAPTNPSYITDALLPYGSHMTFYERLQNTIYWLWIRYMIYSQLFPRQENVMRKHFGEAPPSVYEADKNMELLMIGINSLFRYPVPVTPNVINFHSIHIKTFSDPLPKDLQTFLDDAEDGVIYFSLGTNVFSNKLPEEKIHAFISAFSKLPQKVIWKWESDSLPGKPHNVKIMKWLPQQDLLAHPNVRLFITQCGMQSFHEAVFHAVPLLGIPFIADQKFNAKRIEELGIGLALSFKDVTEESLTHAFIDILHNPRYKKSMNKVSELSKDEAESPLERVVWWTEYVLRHKGAKHLRSAAVDLEWYQYLLLDIMAFVAVAVLIIIFIVYYCVTLSCIYLKKK